MQPLSHIKTLLDSHGLRPKRSLGQNFLIDHNLIRKLVDSASIAPGELILEVGPGTGTMTEELLARGARVIACELDDHLAAILRDTIPHQPNGQNFTLIHGDCLADKRHISPDIAAALRAASPQQPPRFKLVSNLPYGAGTPLMTTLLLDHPGCSLMAVTIQREVADRLAAKPATKDYGALAVIAQSLATVTHIASARPECFWPRPDVTSSMVLLTRRADPFTTDSHGLSEFCRVIFAQRRKQLGSLLGHDIDWPAIHAAPATVGIQPTQRAEELSPEKIIALARSLGRLQESPRHGSDHTLICH